jgi:hypothetical protein
VQPYRRGEAVHVQQIRIDDGNIHLLAAGHRCHLVTAFQFRDHFYAGCGRQQRHQAGSHQCDLLGDEDTYQTARRHQRGHVS